MEWSGEGSLKGKPMKALKDKRRGLNNGLFQSDGDFSNFFKYRISIPSDKSVPNQLKGL
jgi:gamma-glutamylcysteine synthetase